MTSEGSNPIDLELVKGEGHKFLAGIVKSGFVGIATCYRNVRNHLEPRIPPGEII